MNFFLAALGVLGVASSGPLMAATLGATSAGALAIAFWRNAIGAVVMAGPVLVREPRHFGRVTAKESAGLWWQPWRWRCISPASSLPSS